jgi:DNA-binding MarR family transcriptional regulator
MPQDQASPGSPHTGDTHPVVVIDEAIRESFLLFDALDRRTLVALETPLTCSQFHALVALEQNPGQSLSTLAQKLLCAKANASGVVDRLNLLGLVEKEPDPDDGRRIRLRLTTKGKSDLKIAKQMRHEAQERVLTEFQRLHDIALGEVAHVMHKLVQHLRLTPAPAPAKPRRPRPLPPERPRHGRSARR